jgi:hypothetical protein
MTDSNYSYPSLLKRYFSNKSQHLILFGFFILFICSCNNNTPKDKGQKDTVTENKNHIIPKPGTGFSDTLIINTKAAVFFSPDSIQMEKIKGVNEKRIFDMLTHDCHYQMLNAKNSLSQDWPQIKIVEAKKVRYLLFIKEDQSKLIIDLNQKNDICGLFLFDRKKNPVLADMPNIDTVLRLFFK